jgi:hypothetical protein
MEMIVTNGEEYLLLKNYAIYNIWREFSNVTDPHEFYILKSRVIKMGLTDLSNELQTEWEKVKEDYIKQTQAVHFIQNPSIDLFQQLADITNPSNKHE